jgi:predicted Zn-dependent protease
MAVLASHANNLNNLSYSRPFEKEADEKGYELLEENQIDPRGMIELFEILKDNEKTEIPEFLSTHPLTKDRIQNAKELIKQKNYPDHAKLKKDFLLIKKV